MNKILTLITAVLFVSLQTIAQNTITTTEPAPMRDTNAVCVGSSIGVTFTSSGNYFQGNYYVAEISDTTGFFFNPVRLDSILDNTTYYSAGSISVKIPDLPDGCNYYIRVMSTYPLSNITRYGPFCIQHCDLKTNNGEDIHICLTPTTVGIDTPLTIQTHTWNNNQVYNSGNIFKVQLLDTNYFLPVGAAGALGQVAATHDTSLTLTIPALIPLQAMGIQPGHYYLRVIATNTLYSDSSLGSLTRLTIGAPSDNPFTITNLVDYYPQTNSYDTIHGYICPPASNNDYVYILLEPNPYDYNSQFEWHGDFVGDSTSGTSLFFYDQPAFTQIIVNIEQISYGCHGPVSPNDTINVIDIPHVSISTPPYVCLHDTTEATVPYIPTSSYIWTAPLGIITDSVGDSVNVLYNTLGAKTLHISATNICTVLAGNGPVTSSATINVITAPTSGIKDSLHNMTVYFKDTVNGLGDSYEWYFGDGDSSSSQNPVHTYTSLSNFNVTLIVTNQCGIDTSMVTITSLGISKVSLEDDISIIPNPNNGTFNLSYNFTNSQLSTFNSQFVIKDLLGRTIYSTDIKGIEGKEILSLPLNNGVYFWELISSEGIAANGKMVILK